MAHPELLRRVLDVSIPNNRNSISSKELNEEVVILTLSQFGTIRNIYYWESNQKKPHFYVEFDTHDACTRAKAGSPKLDVVLTSIINDTQHKNRFNNLLVSRSTSKAPRYAPYPTPSAANLLSRASVLATGLGEYGRDKNPQHTSSSQRPINFADYGSMALPSFSQPSPSLDSRRANPVNTPSPTGVEVDATLAHHSSRSAASAATSQAKQMIDALKNTRDAMASSSGTALSKTETRTFHINPRFDFRAHITSGRFLRPEATTSNLEFKPTPLQEYFADVYASLQTELYETKRELKAAQLTARNEALLTIGLKKNDTLYRRLLDEANNELRAQKRQEETIKDLGRALKAAEDKAASCKQSRDEYAASLDAARQEIESLRRTIGQIQSIAAALPPSAGGNAA